VRVGSIVQVAYAVDDVRVAAARHAASFGSGPFFVLDHIEIASVRHGNAEAVFDHSSAYGQSGSMMIELVCLHDVQPATLRASLTQRGRGLHHVAYFVDDLVREAERLDTLGYPQAMLATTASGLSFAFHDAVADLGHLWEIYEPTDRLREFYAMVATASAGWDGTNPVRDL
jgi:hypothetical protein